MADISKNTVHIREIIKNIRADQKLKKGLEKAQIKKLWADLMGNSIAPYTSDINYKNGTLTIRLTSSPLREELSRGKDKIIKLMNESFGRDVVKKIIFK